MQKTVESSYLDKKRLLCLIRGMTPLMIRSIVSPRGWYDFVFRIDGSNISTVIGFELLGDLDSVYQTSSLCPSCFYSKS